MSTKQTNKCTPFSLKLKQYISKLLNEGMEPDEIVKDLGLPTESVQSIVKLKYMNEKRLEFKKVAENWKNAANAAEKKIDAKLVVEKESGVKKVKKKSDDQKKKGSSLERKMVKKVEKAMVEWLKTEQEEGLTLYNVLEKAEMFRNEVFTDTNYQRSGFKVTEGWFRDFRKRNGLHKFRYVEEIEKTEARKMAKKLETIVPDFVWGECAGCDGTDCPVHEWISSKPVKKKELKTVGETANLESSSVKPETSSQGQVQSMLTIHSQPTISISIQNHVSSNQSTIPSANIQYLAIQPARFCNSIPSAQNDVSCSAQFQPAMSSVQCFQSPIVSVQSQASSFQPSSVLQIQNGGPTVLNGKYNKVQPVLIEKAGSSCMDANDQSESDSDSSALIIAGEEDEEMDDSIVKTEEPAIMFMDNEWGKAVKNEKEVVNEDFKSLITLRKTKVKEAFDLFIQGLTLLEEYDLFIERRQTFCDGLHKLLDLYQLPDKS